MTLYDFNILLKTQIFSKQDIIYLADKSLKVVKVCHVYLYIYIYIYTYICIKIYIYYYYYYHYYSF